MIAPDAIDPTQIVLTPDTGEGYAMWSVPAIQLSRLTQLKTMLGVFVSVEFSASLLLPVPAELPNFHD